MDHRKISKEKYVIAGVLTILIFVLGVALGMIIDNERLQWITRVNSLQDINYQSLQFQYLYLSTLGNDNESCAVLHATLEDSIADLGYTIDKMEEFQKDSEMKDDEYDLLRRRYILDNLKYWLFARRTQEVCYRDLVPVLYFYSDDNCEICPSQGVILTYFKKKYNDRFLVFPLNADLRNDEPMVDMLMMRYGVTELPTLIINETRYEGVVERGALSSIICANFKDKSLCVQP